MSSRITCVARGLLLGCLICGSGTAYAQAGAGSAEAGARDDGSVATDGFARKVFAAGKAAYDMGNYRDALQYFQQAFELSGRPQVLYNIGQSADRLRMDETALKALKRYIELVPDAPNRSEVEERLAVLNEVLTAKHETDTSNGASLAPDAVARAAQSNASSSPDVTGADTRDTAGNGLTSQWWFWAGAGTVAMVVLVAVVAATGGTTVKTRPQFQGSSGKVIATLELEHP